MNFFEHQDRARRKTGLLVWLFVLAVIGLIAGIYFLVMALFLGGVEQLPDNSELVTQLGPATLWRPDVLGGVALAVMLVVGGGSLYKTAELASGGEAVARMLGGELLPRDSIDPTHRKLLNVVEEMAIAAGLPIPPVYLLEHERGINAFAAGYRPEEAVIGVTRGCVDSLSRDELQGVIAHEFSHILNGDMRLNIRLMAIVHGILLVGLIGYYVFRMAAASGSRRSSSDKGNATVPVLALGLGLMAVGFVGTLIGNLIKAAVSRQREFLADASAVQFTRTRGVASALARIGSLNLGSAVKAEHATEASHMFFASGVQALFATHPPLKERIARIDQYWQAQQAEEATTTEPVSQPRLAAAALTGAAAFAGDAGTVAPRPAVPSPSAPPPMPSPEQALDAIGKPTPQQLARAHDLLEALPPAVREAAHEPYGARAVVYALLLDADFSSCQKQFERLAAEADPAVYKTTLSLHNETSTLPREARLPLLDICLSPLKELSPEQYERFRDNVHALAAADNRLSLFEWTLQKVVLHVLDPHFGRSRRQRARRRPAGEDVAVVLSALAHAGGDGDEAIRFAFKRGVEATGLKSLSLQPWDRAMFKRLDKSLDALSQISAKSKAKLVRGLAETASADGTIIPRELELLRAVATTLDCPMPLVA
jgi:Zn-dependent protease with chaperone function